LTDPLSRRELFARGAALATYLEIAAMSASTAAAGSRSPFRISLNTSTIRGQKLPLEQEIKIASRAGYQGIEPWVEEIEKYVAAGGSLHDLGARLRDAGLAMPSAIGFAEWIVDDDTQRAHGLEQMKRDMELVAQLGGTHIAAPCAGAPMQKNMDPVRIAERYGAIVDIGVACGVLPMIEVWGFSEPLKRLGQAVFAAVESGRDRACVLADVYHLYKGGSSLEGLALLRGATLPVLHINDYPANPPQATITDADRVYPGDGIAPIGRLFEILRRIGFEGFLSVELFNESYWKQDAAQVAKTAIDKVHELIRRAHPNA
jgi:sugar phosphate isomerase/epimerase